MRTLAACAAFAASVFDAAALFHNQQPGGEFLEGLEELATAPVLKEEKSVYFSREESPTEADEEQTRPRKNTCVDLRTPTLCDVSDNEAPAYSVGLVVSTYAEDIAWLNSLDWNGNVSVYTRDRSQQRLSRFQSKLVANLAIAELSEQEVMSAGNMRKYPVNFASIPNNGNEALGYLTHIIENYYNLPDVVFFVQGRQCSDFAKFNMAKALSNVRKCFPMDKGYLDMNRYDGRKAHGARCKDRKALVAHPLRLSSKAENVQSIWDSLFQQEFGDMPDRLCWDTHAQFGVMKELILKHPLSFYRKLSKGVEDKMTTMEFFWRLTFDRTAVEMRDHSEDEFQRKKDLVLNHN